VRFVLQLLVDTSTWLDLAKRRDGQKLIVTLRQLVRTNGLKLVVPQVVLDEFDRNRPRIESSMTDSVAERFRLIRRDVDDFGGDGYTEALDLLSGLAHEMPLIGAMATRNFDDIRALLDTADVVEPTEFDRKRAIERGLDKRAPFHRSKNSVADALIIEIYGSHAGQAPASEVHAFVTSNSDDFSLPKGDARVPHPDIAEMFGPASLYGLGVAGLEAIVRGHFGADFDELMEESDFEENPRRLDEILEAESDYFDRIWYHRSLQHEYRLEDVEGPEAVERLHEIAGPGRRRVEAKFTEPGQLGPYTDFELGMLNGKLSALRWVLGSEWDFLDT
jgi:hypothetical protein